MSFLSYTNALPTKQVRALRVPDLKFRDAAWREAERHAALVEANDASAAQCWAKFRPDVPAGTDAELTINIHALPEVIR